VTALIPACRDTLTFHDIPLRAIPDSGTITKYFALVLAREVAMRLLISTVAFLAIGFAMQITSDAHAKSGKAASTAKQSSHGWTQCNPQRCYHTKKGQPRRPYYYPRNYRAVDPMIK